jgi:biopolymer transport protein ExbD
MPVAGGGGKPPTVDPDERARMDYKKALRNKRRKEREMAGEIRELNIVAMMDMMTILLVFLLKSYQTSPVTVQSAEDLEPPRSTTRQNPKDTIPVTVTKHAILVADKVVVSLENGQVPAQYKEGGATGNFIQPLYDALDKEVNKQKYVAQFNPNAPFTGEMSIIGDKKVNYRLLTEILYTAGKAQLDNFRFIVYKKEGEGGAPKSEE